MEAVPISLHFKGGCANDGLWRSFSSNTRKPKVRTSKLFRPHPLLTVLHLNDPISFVDSACERALSLPDGGDGGKTYTEG
jgi:hypothetical protein